MSGVRITVDDSDVKDLVRRYFQKTGNMSPLFADFGEYMMRRTHERFSAQKAPDGSGWKPLAPATLKAKKGRKILTEDGYLRGSINYKALRKKIAIGSNKVYAAIHQLGGKAGRGHKALIPARRYLGFNDDDFAEFKQLLIDHLFEA